MIKSGYFQRLKPSRIQKLTQKINIQARNASKKSGAEHGKYSDRNKVVALFTNT